MSQEIASRSHRADCIQRKHLFIYNDTLHHMVDDIKDFAVKESFPPERHFSQSVCDQAVERGVRGGLKLERLYKVHPVRWVKETSVSSRFGLAIFLEGR